MVSAVGCLREVERDWCGVVHACRDPAVHDLDDRRPGHEVAPADDHPPYVGPIRRCVVKPKKVVSRRADAGDSVLQRTIVGRRRRAAHSSSACCRYVQEEPRLEGPGDRSVHSSKGGGVPPAVDQLALVQSAAQVGRPRSQEKDVDRRVELRLEIGVDLELRVEVRLTSVRVGRLPVGNVAPGVGNQPDVDRFVYLGDADIQRIADLSCQLLHLADVQQSGTAIAREVRAGDEVPVRALRPAVDAGHLLHIVHLYRDLVLTCPGLLDAEVERAWPGKRGDVVRVIAQPRPGEVVAATGGAQRGAQDQQHTEEVSHGALSA